MRQYERLVDGSLELVNARCVDVDSIIETLSAVNAFNAEPDVAAPAS